MKKAIAIIILGLLICNVGFAKTVRNEHGDFEVKNIKVGLSDCTRFVPINNNQNNKEYDYCVHQIGTINYVEHHKKLALTDQTIDLKYILQYMYYTSGTVFIGYKRYHNEGYLIGRFINKKKGTDSYAAYDPITKKFLAVEGISPKREAFSPIGESQEEINKLITMAKSFYDQALHVESYVQNLMNEYSK